VLPYARAVRPALSVQAFLDDPYGRYLCGRRHLMFAPSRELIGFAAWGCLDPDDVRALLQLCDIGVVEGAAPHCFLADLRGLEFMDPHAFALFVDYTRRHRAVLARKVVRKAELRPAGLVGAVIAGFSQVAALPHPDQAFDDPHEALAWLGVPAVPGAELLGQLDALRVEASGAGATVRRAREVLASTGCAELDGLAAQLGLSRRSAQRALREAGTTFRLELRAARLQRAREFLRQGTHSLTWIAAELGYSSVQHFSTAFRRLTGETPSAWRARHRGPRVPARQAVGSQRTKGP
jgi:AraC-like DNA-binding protein